MHLHLHYTHTLTHALAHTHALTLTLTYALAPAFALTLTHAHIFNALDAVYVQDATDNSQYNGYGDKVHAAHNAEVFLGTPRYANVGITVNF